MCHDSVAFVVSQHRVEIRNWEGVAPSAPALSMLVPKPVLLWQMKWAVQDFRPPENALRLVPVRACHCHHTDRKPLG